MTAFTTAPSYALNPYQPSKDVGILMTRAGAVTIDSPFTTDTGTKPELSKFLVCGTSGNIVVQFADKEFGYFPSATAGQLLPISAIRVVTSHTFTNGGLLTTTATGIWWYGGV